MFTSPASSTKRYAGRPSKVLRRTADGGSGLASVAHAWAGESRIVAGSSAGDRSRRSAADTLGKSQYIMPMPDGNHSRNTRHSTTPSQRCTKMRNRFTVAAIVERSRRPTPATFPEFFVRIRYDRCWTLGPEVSVMKTRLVSGLIAAVVMVTAAPVLAHHPFAAEYDRNKAVHLTGTVAKVDWANPHAMLSVDA